MKRPTAPVLLLVLVLLVAGTATTLGVLRTAATFDEIVLVAGGARGWETGRWDLAPEHPPLMQYVYGLPVHVLEGPRLPSEAAVSDAQRAMMGFRYDYARTLLWQMGNRGQRILTLARLPAVLGVLLLVGAVFLLGRPALGAWPALLAAGMVAFLPDVLGHGGLAYNDLPAALAYLLAVYALDGAVRRPTPRSGALAGAAVALALAVKFSSLVLGPVAVVLLGLEARHRARDGAWARAVGGAVLAGAAALYVGLALAYLGELDLATFRYGIGFALNHVAEGHTGAAYLLGETSMTGWRWFYPVAFLFKTPVAFQALVLLGLAGFVAARARPAPAQEEAAGQGGGLRAPLVGLAVFAAVLVASRLAIGFRHALPLFPLLAIVVAAGLARLWGAGPRAARVAVVTLAVVQAAIVLSWHPWYLGFVSLYHPDRDTAHEVLIDSNTDWGQGLKELAAELRARDIDTVLLSYFGSALPEAYGIRYRPLESFFPIPGTEPPGSPLPAWAVVSATNLHDVYVQHPDLDFIRALEPTAVVAHSYYLYRLP